MKNDDRDGLLFSALERLFQKPHRDSRVAGMDLAQQFHFLGAQARGASLAAKQFGELGGELPEGPNVLRLRPVVVDAVLCLLLLRSFVAFLQ